MLRNTRKLPEIDLKRFKKQSKQHFYRSKKVKKGKKPQTEKVKFLAKMAKGKVKFSKISRFWKEFLIYKSSGGGGGGLQGPRRRSRSQDLRGRYFPGNSDFWLFWFKKVKFLRFQGFFKLFKRSKNSKQTRKLVIFTRKNGFVGVGNCFQGFLGVFRWEN